MNIHVLAAMLAAAPAAAIWPRGRWAAWIMTAGALVFWLAVLVAACAPEDRVLWLGAGGWSLFGCLYSSWVIARNASEYRRLEASLKESRRKKESLAKSASDARMRGAKAEAEQREVLALYGMVKGLSEALTWEEIRPRLETAVQNYLGVEEFAIYVSDLRSQKTLHPLATRRLGASVGANWDTLERCLQERGIPLSSPYLMEAPELAVASPIREGDELMGFFFARVPAGAEPKAMLAKVSSFTEEIAFAFRRLKLFQEVERLSQIDGLTGVCRRGVLDERLKEEVVRARTFKTTFCLMLLDIDHFKKLNDAYGHQFGDDVLRRVGALLKESVYETDFVARYGGEEFAILLPRADPEGVLRKAEAVRAAFEREQFPLAMEVVRATVSIGMAHFPRDGNSPEDIIRQADQALYHAKESGRNRAVDVAAVRRR